MSDSTRWAAVVVSVVAAAWIVIACTGGFVRGVSPFPRDSFFKVVSPATWWVDPVLIGVAGALCAWATRSTPLVAASMGALVPVEIWLCWRWRPGRADELWLPRWLQLARQAPRGGPIRDAGAWRRHLVSAVAGGAIVAVAFLVLRRP